MDVLAPRVAAGPAGSAELFRADMICPVPVTRWDNDNATVARLGGRMPTRFAALMDGRHAIIFYTLKIYTHNSWYTLLQPSMARCVPAAVPYISSKFHALARTYVHS